MRVYDRQAEHHPHITFSFARHPAREDGHVGGQYLFLC